MKKEYKVRNNEKSKNQKMKTNQTSQKKTKEKKEIELKEFKKDNNVDLKKYFNKINITYFILLMIDIILVIYLAKKNIVNYVVIGKEEIFVSKTSYLLLGRNYINLIVTCFFYIYTCLINHFFLNQKNTKRFLIWLLIGILFINCLLFFLFTKKIY